MLNRSHIVWVWSSVDLLIAAIAILVSLQFQSLQTTQMSLSGIVSVRLNPKNFVLLTLFLVIWTGLHQLCGLYSGRSRSRKALLPAAFAASVLGSLFYFLFPLFSHDPDRALLAPVLIFFVVAALLSLSARSSSMLGLFQRQRAVNALIVGSGPLALSLFDSLTSARSPRYKVLGFVDSTTTFTPPAFTTAHTLGTLEELETLLMRTHVDEVLIALPLRSCYDHIQQTIATCERIGVPVTYHYQPFVHQIGFSTVAAHSLRPYISHRPSRLEESKGSKRAIDLALAIPALIVLSPIFASIAVAIKLTTRGPIFFVQERYGLNRQRFKMWKFRTMVPDAEARQAALESLNEAQGPVFKIKHDPRVTPLGRFFRKTSLDELPQLFNVLKGNMSLVGPRPLPIRDVTRFSEASLMRRFSVKPGLTCLWQISGRSQMTFEKWMIFDLQYIDTWSPLLDAKILLLTVPAVIKGSGAL